MNFNNKEFYSRNWLYISPQDQKKLSEIKVLICGSGLGSFISEVLLRTGVQNLILADGDSVSLSNLNRQNYTTENLGKNKASELKKRLNLINPNANIQCIPRFLTEEDLKQLIPTVDVIINTIDFDSNAFISCNELCLKHNKPEIFPINFGFGATLIVSKNKTKPFEEFFSVKGKSELKSKLIEHLLQDAPNYMKKALQTYKKTKKEYDPQLGISSFATSALVGTIILRIALKKKVKVFPNYYYFDFFN
jgi:molybdopterin/thiamine biosynthesis adenylyltransferase